MTRPNLTLSGLLLAMLVWGMPLWANPTVPVEIRASLLPETPVVPGERVRIVLTIATARWFTAGTRFVLPEVPGLILLQNQSFASNSTESRDGESWSVQRWTLDAFALRAGRFDIPPIEVITTVSEGPGRNTELIQLTPALTVNVAIPPELQGVTQWIASPDVELASSIAETSVSLNRGGALKRRVTLKATDVMAMLLPDINQHDSQTLRPYREPPLLRNRANRGQLQAERQQTTTWIATESGQTVLPGTTVYWWHTGRKVLIPLSLPAIEVDVRIEDPSSVIDRNPLMLWGTGLLLIAALGFLYGHHSGWQRCRSFVRRGDAAIRRTLRPPKGSALPAQLNPGGSPGRSLGASPRER